MNIQGHLNLLKVKMNIISESDLPMATVMADIWGIFKEGIV